METRLPDSVYSIRDHLESGYLLDLMDADRIRDNIADRLRELPDGSVLAIDLGGVITRASCVARFLGEPLKKIAAGEIRRRFLVLCGPLDYLTERDIRMALEDEGVVIAVRDEDGPRLLGTTGRVIEETFRALRASDEVTSLALMGRLGLDIKTANGRIAKLESMGLLDRVGEASVDGGGRRFSYRLVE